MWVNHIGIVGLTSLCRLRLTSPYVWLMSDFPSACALLTETMEPNHSTHNSSPKAKYSQYQEQLKGEVKDDVGSFVWVYSTKAVSICTA